MGYWGDILRCERLRLPREAVAGSPQHSLPGQLPRRVPAASRCPVLSRDPSGTGCAAGTATALSRRGLRLSIRGIMAIRPRS